MCPSLLSTEDLDIRNCFSCCHIRTKRFNAGLCFGDYRVDFVLDAPKTQTCIEALVQSNENNIEITKKTTNVVQRLFLILTDTVKLFQIQISSQRANTDKHQNSQLDGK